MTTILEFARKMQRGEAPPPPIGRLLGFVLKAIEPGRAVFEMEADERHHNPMGTLHGGVYCDLADAAMGYAYAATLARRDVHHRRVEDQLLPPRAPGQADRRGQGREGGRHPRVRRVRRQGPGRPAHRTGGEHLHETEARKQVGHVDRSALGLAQRSCLQVLF